jgi:hypothetical protein
VQSLTGYEQASVGDLLDHNTEKERWHLLPKGKFSYFGCRSVCDIPVCELACVDTRHDASADNEASRQVDSRAPVPKQPNAFDDVCSLRAPTAKCQEPERAQGDALYNSDKFSEMDHVVAAQVGTAAYYRR